MMHLRKKTQIKEREVKNGDVKRLRMQSVDKYVVNDNLAGMVVARTNEKYLTMRWWPKQVVRKVLDSS